MGWLDGRQVLVTGGAGFVGSWLCERLLADGARVQCVDSLITGSRRNIAHLLDDPGFRFSQADVCDGIPAHGRLDLVFHLASPASPLHHLRQPVDTLRVGSLGTFNALDLARWHGARFLLASTSEVHGDPLEHPQHESYRGNVNPVGPRSAYDEAKRFAEAITSAYRRHHGVDTTIARIFSTYGPRMDLDDGRVVPTFLRQALRGEALTVAGDGSQTRSLCFVTDTVEGVLRLAFSRDAGPVNIGNDAELTMQELADVVRRLVGSESRVEYVALPEGDPRVRRPDLSAARARLGWSPVTPTERGLAMTLAWMRSEIAARERRPMDHRRRLSG